MFPLAQTEATFSVKSCEDISLVLSETAGMPTLNTYQVVLGINKNAQSEIRDGVDGHALVRAQTSNLLSCDVMRSFWVSWQDGVLCVGTGYIIGQQMFMSWTSPRGSIRVSGISTASVYQAEWDMTAIVGQFILFINVQRLNSQRTLYVKLMNIFVSFIQATSIL